MMNAGRRLLVHQFFPGLNLDSGPAAASMNIAGRWLMLYL